MKSSKTAVTFIVFGLFLIGIDVASYFIRSVPVRYGRGIRLDEQPEMFWVAASIYLVAGIILIGMGTWKLARR